jgi:DNA-binding SARP family transcriptional activator
MPDFRILGPLEVSTDDGPVDVTGARQRALLAILLLHAGETVSTDRLMDELWGDAPPEVGTTALRVRVSQLRRALGTAGELIVTRPPGYALAIDDDQLDLRRFERLVEQGDQALVRGDPAAAAGVLRDALALWHGPPLADFSYAPFAQTAIVRLEELRLAAIELQLDAELALGHHARAVGELRALVRDHPLRERLCGQLMLALYRDGRQAEALDAYRDARRRLVDEIGLEPGPELQELERQILAQQDLRPQAAAGAASLARVARRAVLVLAGADATLDRLAALAGPLARREGHELLIASIVSDGALLGDRAARLHAVRADLAAVGVAVRVAAFTSDDPGSDVLRLAAEEDIALLLAELPAEMPAELGPLLDRPVCDLALVAGVERPLAAGPVLVPFGGHEHDWAAAELGAWLASAAGASLMLVGAGADPAAGRRDASRLLGHASIALQRALGISAEPLLAAPGSAGIIAAAAGASAIVAGLSERFPRVGLGPVRSELAARAPVPVLLVRRGLRPGGLAPPRTLTRFTWSVT